MKTISDTKYEKELVKLGFSRNLIIDDDETDCINWINHCEKYNMKFLKGTYGTIVNKDFDKIFKLIKVSSRNEDIWDRLSCRHDRNVNLPLDHTNLFKSKILKDVYILTSSPYSFNIFDYLEDFNNYNFSVYVIHNQILDYYGFIDRKLRHPLSDFNCAFTDATEEEIWIINKDIYEKTGINNALRRVK